MNYRSALDSLFGKSAMDAATAHARSVFPHESCGYISGGGYVACTNKAEKPEEGFLIDNSGYDDDYRAGKVQAIVHSQPNGPIYPSHKDMEQQLATDLPWIIINLNEDSVSSPVAWGDTLPILPIVGRPFVHGVFDCYTAVRDLFRVGTDELHKQNIGWPFPPIELPNFARGDDWWRDSEDDLYSANLAKVGFRPIARTEAKPGDCFLIKIGDRNGNPKGKLNHAGALIGHEMIVHHLPARLSVRTPAGGWAHAADMWVRYEGKTS